MKANHTWKQDFVDEHGRECRITICTSVDGYSWGAINCKESATKRASFTHLHAATVPAMVAKARKALKKRGVSIV